MKPPLHSPSRSSFKRGFTLLEMTIVIVFGLAISSAGMMLLTQQVGIVRTFNQQNFILKDAPGINHSLTSILSRADAIRLHRNFSQAINDNNPRTQNCRVLVAAFRNVDNTTSFGIISLETLGGEKFLNYYYYDPTQPPPARNRPSWTISRNVEGADFDLVDGLFRMTLTGPEAETITYTISPNQ